MRRFQAIAASLLAAAITFALTGALALQLGWLPVQAYFVQTGSMMPTIPPKSEVFVKPRDDYQIGRVITFVIGDRVLTHRLVGYRPDGSLITKGDANETPDSWRVTRADVRGEVVAAPRMLGYWMVFLRRPTGAASIALGAACLWLLWSILTPKPETSASGIRDAV